MGKVRPSLPMQITVQRLSPVVVQFNVEIDKARVESEVEKAYSSVAKNAKVRGFRPGKAPRRVLSHMYGARIAKEVADKLVEETYPKAVSDQKLQPVTQPAIEAKSSSTVEPFSYTARVEVLPLIESVKYEGLAAKRAGHKVTRRAGRRKSSIGCATGTRRSKSRPTPRAAQKGDAVTIDFEVEVEGQKVRRRRHERFSGRARPRHAASRDRGSARRHEGRRAKDDRGADAGGAPAQEAPRQDGDVSA